MTKIANVAFSPERHTFGARRYEEKLENDPLDESALAMVSFYESHRERSLRQLEDETWRTNNMEYDLRSTDWILEKVKGSDVYAQNLYAAMCNRDFRKIDVMEILKGSTWHCSWRYSGGIIADMREEGDYIDWYCSGIRDPDDSSGYVGEGMVTPEIRDDLERLGWLVLPSEYDDQE